MEYNSALKRMENLHFPHYNMDEFWGHYAKWNKPVIKMTNIVWFHLHEVSRVVKFIEVDDGTVVIMGWRKREWGVII